MYDPRLETRVANKDVHGDPIPGEGYKIVYGITSGQKGVWWDGTPMPGGSSLNPPSYESYAGGVNVEPTSNPTLAEKFQPIKAESVFSKTFDVIKQTLEDSAVRLISQNKDVQEKIEEQKVQVGKDVLWKYIPYILIGTVLVALIVRFK